MSEMLDFSVDQTIDNSTNFWKNSPIPTGFEPEIQEILLGKRKRDFPNNHETSDYTQKCCRQKLYEFEANSIKSHKSQSYPESLHLSEIRKSCGEDSQI